jgi:uncharacterized repeat protein (TIGR03803 family)
MLTPGSGATRMSTPSSSLGVAAVAPSSRELIRNPPARSEGTMDSRLTAGLRAISLSDFAARNVLAWAISFAGLWLTSYAALAQGPALEVLHSFERLDDPFAGVILGSDGRFYGTTGSGGLDHHGTVYVLDSAGNFSDIHQFNGVDGAAPLTELIEATDGFFYGNAGGTIFRLSPTGDFLSLFSFNGTNGREPSALIQATDGNFYGTTASSGASGPGAVFRMTATGQVSNVHTFTDTEGRTASHWAGLVQASDGDLYGVTSGSDYFACPLQTCVAAIFRMDLLGNFEVVHTLTPSEGSIIHARLVASSDGWLYGAARRGGVYQYGTLFRVHPVTGTFEVLHSFDGSDGREPVSLMQATDGRIYGKTVLGGDNGVGTIFRFDPQSGVTAIHSFDQFIEGNGCCARFAQGPDGHLYGTTVAGGAHDGGTLYRLLTFLGPPQLTVASVVPSAGSTSGGRTVTISGTGFVLDTSVTFGGQPATSVTFIDSTSLRATTPPYAAGTVDVAVVNPDGQTGVLPLAFTYRSPTLLIDGQTASARAQGETFVFTGSDYTPNRTVTRSVLRPDGSVAALEALVADAGGRIEWTFSVGCTDVSGDYGVWAVDEPSEALSNQVTETIVQNVGLCPPQRPVESPPLVTPPQRSRLLAWPFVGERGNATHQWCSPNGWVKSPSTCAGFIEGQGDHVGIDHHAQDWNRIPDFASGEDGTTADRGQPLLSATAGLVIYADSAPNRPCAGGIDNYGRQVIVAFGNGLAIRYTHLNAVFVAKGDQVWIGRPIGEIGDTGLCTDRVGHKSHLHSAVYRNIDLPVGGCATRRNWTLRRQLELGSAPTPAACGGTAPLNSYASEFATQFEFVP